jgi:Zn-dependent protease/CBS domain-containing protein
MSSSWTLCRVAGIPIRVHWTFLLLLAWVVLGYRSEGRDAQATMQGVAFVLALFGCIVLHELGHALAARRYGVATADITLLPIGGLARLDRIPEDPRQEVVIALAGPAVNFVIVASLLIGGVRPGVYPGSAGDPFRAGFLWQLLVVNGFIAVFNLLPAFPMDGGRVFRALLAMRLDYLRATQIAAATGRSMALLFGLLGIASGNPLLILIAVMVWAGATGEALQVEQKHLLAGARVRDAMLTDYRQVAAEDTLGHAAELLISGWQHDFPVVEHGRAVGLLTRDALIQGLARGGPEARVGGFVRPGLASIDAGEPLASALDRLRAAEGACLQVLDHGRPVGLLTPENLGEFILIRSARGRAPATHAWPDRRGLRVDPDGQEVALAGSSEESPP